MDCDLTSNLSYTSRRMEIQIRKNAHKKRCRTLPAIRPGEVEQLAEAFITVRGVTQCPPAYAAAIQ
jgi:hypothetical protein